MHHFKRSILAAAVAGALCGGIGFVQAASSNTGQGVQKLDEEHWKYKHMHHAAASLREARKELDATEDIFKGRKQEAIDHVDHAIHAIEDGLKEQNDEAVLPAASPSARNLEDDHYPHVHLALERLKDAKKDLEDAETIFGGHRDEAISHTEKAIRQLEEGLHDAGA